MAIEKIPYKDTYKEIVDRFPKRKNEFVRTRSEEFDYYCWDIRKSLGELDQDIDPFSYRIKEIESLLDKGYDIKLFWDKFNKTFNEYAELNKDKPFELEFFLQLAVKNKVRPRALVYPVLEYLATQKKLSNTIYPVEEIKLKDGMELNNLFKQEVLPSKKSDFIEQRFINYLEANPDKIVNIHWRNFERLTAEFFRRSNYEVNLGPGSKDGGIDLRIYDKTNTYKPYIIVQCKRNGKTNKVKIETVKSLYTDVEFEGAQKGLIATTSTIAKGGKDLISIRKYPLQFAENEEIKNWISEMKK